MESSKRKAAVRTLGANLSLEHAREMLVNAFQTFAYISPVTSLKPLRQGDVMVSQSGNFRLVLNTKKTRQGIEALFLTHNQNRNELVIEDAILSGIDLSRLDSVVVRRAANPLGKFSSLAKGLMDEEDVFVNTEVLLRTGAIGSRFEARLIDSSCETDRGLEIPVYVQPHNGRIIAVQGMEVKGLALPCRLVVDRSLLPTSEFIVGMRFPEGVPDIVCRRVIAASVLANTIQNARNLANLVCQVEEREPFDP